MHHGYVRVCVPCRHVTNEGFDCPLCHTPYVRMSTKWRAPGRHNHKAWKRIEAGDWLWELDPKAKQWEERDYEVDHQNPKRGKTLLFASLADARKNWRYRWKMKHPYDNRF